MDLDKITTFFVQHFEKMLLAVIIVAAGLLIFNGFGLESYLDKHDPDRLKRL